MPISNRDSIGQPLEFGDRVVYASAYTSSGGQMANYKGRSKAGRHQVYAVNYAWDRSLKQYVKAGRVVTLGATTSIFVIMQLKRDWMVDNA